jgi:hypothetical protein
VRGKFPSAGDNGRQADAMVVLAKQVVETVPVFEGDCFAYGFLVPRYSLSLSLGNIKKKRSKN